MLAILQSLGMCILDLFKSRRRLEAETYKGRRHLVSDSGPWPYVSQPTFVLSSANHVNEKHAEATEQQDSACR